MDKKIIITDHLHPVLADWLTENGYDVNIQEEISNEALADVINEYAGLVLSTRINVTQALLDKATRLKFIARAGSGMENIDVAYAKAKGILVVNSPEGNANAVGEHALGMLLGLTNKIYKADHEIRTGIWQREENRGIELDGKTIGIIGFGHTGPAFAKKLNGFDVRILVYDKYKEVTKTNTIHPSSLEMIREEADVISLHIPHTPETHHLIDEDFINSSGNSFYFLNTSRGKIADTNALIKGLNNGKIKGAALDVFENERFYHLTGSDKANMEILCNRENVILTPHIAGWTVESHFKLASVLMTKLANAGMTKVSDRNMKLK